MASLKAKEHLADSNGWKERHNSAVAYPQGIEKPFVNLLKDLQRYIDDYQKRYESSIGNDGYASDYILDIAKGLRGLLSMDLGKRLDCGTLDSFILDLLKENGFDIDNL